MECHRKGEWPIGSLPVGETPECRDPVDRSPADHLPIKRESDYIISNERWPAWRETIGSWSALLLA